MSTQLLRLPKPSLASVAHREQIAQTISPLKRVRPHVPFWKLSAHRVPTLWTLYRGLLKNAGDDNIRFRIQRLFRVYRSLTSPKAAIARLQQGHRWLEIFKNAQQGNAHLQAVLTRYAKMIDHKRKKEEFQYILRQEALWQARLRNRPIITGSPMRPTQFHGPLPRMKPQPAHIGAMIRKRIIARDRRLEDTYRIKSWLEDVQQEVKFERNLARTARDVPFERVFSGRLQKGIRAGRSDIGAADERGDTDTIEPKDSEGYSTYTKPETLQDEWQHWLQDHLQLHEASFALEKARSSLPFPPTLLHLMKRARIEKYHNKKREAEREARGEVLANTLKRRGSGFPVAVRQKWSKRKYEEMHVMKRSKAVVGYVGILKRKYGWKVPKEEDRYEGRDEQRLRGREETIRRVMEIRRQWAERSAVEGAEPMEREKMRESELEVLKKLDEAEAGKTRGRLSLRRWRELVRDYSRTHQTTTSAKTPKQSKTVRLTTKQWKELARQKLEAA